MSTLAVVEEVLRETAVPMSVKEIVERAGSRLPSRSKTPDTVVARDLSMDIKRKGEASIFVRTSPGRYTMRALWQGVAPDVSAVEAPMASPMVVSAPAPTPVLAAALRQERAAPLQARPTLPPIAKELEASRSNG